MRSEIVAVPTERLDTEAHLLAELPSLRLEFAPRRSPARATRSPAGLQRGVDHRAGAARSIATSVTQRHLGCIGSRPATAERKRMYQE